MNPGTARRSRRTRTTGNLDVSGAAPVGRRLPGRRVGGARRGAKLALRKSRRARSAIEATCASGGYAGTARVAGGALFPTSGACPIADRPNCLCVRMPTWFGSRPPA
jgi:hypothetical protein